MPMARMSKSFFASGGAQPSFSKKEALSYFLIALAAVQPAKAIAQNVTLPGTQGQTCVQVKIAGQAPSPYNCLNQQLQQEVQGMGQTEASPPVSATSPSNQVGTFNEQGVAEQYGKNFGKSAIPYRPPAPVYGGSLGTTR